MTKTPIKNDRFLRAIWREPVDVTPIWIMRQAGRYLPEYRKTRERAGSFLKLCKTPDWAAEVTLQPLLRFPLDAAILFSDILTIPDAMGLGLHFKEGEGPQFERPLQTEKSIASLPSIDPEEGLGYVLETIKLIQAQLAGSVPLIGFCGSPWTLAAYMVEGKAVPSFPSLQKMRLEHPALLHDLLKKLAKAVASHLNAQINAGVDAVMIFDTWGGLLDTVHYEIFSLHYIREIIQSLIRQQEARRIPVIVFTKGGGQWVSKIAASGCDVIGLDWQVDIGKIRNEVGDRVALQGNMNPDILLTSKETIRSEVNQILERFGKGSGHVFNLGHGITPDVPPDHVAYLVECVHTLSKSYHS